MCQGDEDGDGVDEDEAGGQLGQKEGEGKDENGGDEVEKVKEGQTNHETRDNRKFLRKQKSQNTCEKCLVCALSSKILQ